MAFEPHVVAHRVVGFPAIAEGRIGDDSVKQRFLCGIQLPENVPIIEQRIAVEDLKLRVLHPMQQHVHAGKVVGGDVLLLAEDLADPFGPHPLTQFNQQGRRTAREIQDAGKAGSLPGGGFLTVQSHNG